MAWVGARRSHQACPAVGAHRRTAAMAAFDIPVICRCPGADVANILRHADSSGQVLPMYATSARSPEEAHRQGALHITLLQDPLDLTEKYSIEGTETQGHRAARRSEQLLQLFLYLHVLAAEQPGRSHRGMARLTLLQLMQCPSATYGSACVRSRRARYAASQPITDHTLRKDAASGPHEMRGCLGLQGLLLFSEMVHKKNLSRTSMRMCSVRRCA